MMELVFKPKIGAVRLQKKRRVNPSGYLDDTYLRLDGTNKMLEKLIIKYARFKCGGTAAYPVLDLIRDSDGGNTVAFASKFGYFDIWYGTTIQGRYEECLLKTTNTAAGNVKLQSHNGSAYVDTAILRGGLAELYKLKLFGPLLNPDQYIELGHIIVPAASEEYRGKLCMIRYGTGDPDKVFVCLKNADDSYDWVEVCSGTP